MEERIKLHVDLDVHKDGISVAVAEPGRAPGRLIGKVTHHASRSQATEGALRPRSGSR
ncbi:hypothetical protein ACSFBF_33295 [Variovorax sp. ZT5P49]|uniref:hypothetical protein n=1 Tax=Variovorax sp. ZT5P49 TaxID=3443733 RepID=UPI003F4857C9